MVALVVLCGLVFLGHKFIWMPSQKQSRALAEANRDAAKSHAQAAESHADAAKSHVEAARFNSITSGANERTAAHLETLTKLVLQAAIQQKGT